MDRRATLVATLGAPPAATVPADQAVFTSVRSATGEGYRIIAASGGVQTQEQKEITRQAPSHGSLCDESAEATALSCYPLSTGRQCVACTRHAGAEHTGRGGYRVYTHLVLLDADAYGRFDANPLQVQASLNETVGDKPRLDAGAGLERLALPIREKTYEQAALRPPAALRNEGAADLLARLVGCVLRGRRSVVIDGPSPFDLLAWTLAAVPLSLREQVSASVGLKYSRSRRLGLVFVTSDGGQARRTLHGEDVECYEASRPTRPGPGELGPWPTLIGLWFGRGRYRSILRLVSLIGEDAPHVSLDRIAAVLLELARGEATRTGPDDPRLEPALQRARTLDVETAIIRRHLEAEKS